MDYEDNNYESQVLKTGKEDADYIICKINRSRIASIISKYTGIRKSKILACIQEFGLENVFDKAHLMDLTDDELKKLMELKEIIVFGG